MKKHVTSFELSKQLFEAGLTKSLSYWCNDGESNHWYVAYCENGINEKMLGKQLYPAFLADEILDRLPGLKVTQEQNHIYIEIFKTENEKWTIKYCDTGVFSNVVKGFISQESLADAAAKMWLYLKKENLL